MAIPLSVLSGLLIMAIAASGADNDEECSRLTRRCRALETILECKLQQIKRLEQLLVLERARVKTEAMDDGRLAG